MDVDYPIIDIDASCDGTFSVGPKSGLTAREAGDALYEFLRGYKVTCHFYDGPPSESDLGLAMEGMKSRLLDEIAKNDPYLKLLDGVPSQS